MSYPEIFDDDFYKKLLDKKEFHTVNKNLVYNKRQQFLKNYITPNSPYDRILLMHQTGAGKTLAAIAIAEEFKKLKNKSIGKTIIITKNDVIRDVFIKEMSTKCCSYNDFGKPFSKLKEDEIKDFKKKVKRNYEFMTFGSLTNKILGTKQLDGSRTITGDKLSNFSNRTVIIDEFHNILGNDYYKAIQQALDKSINTRLILLSATPFVDSIENLYQISNLLNTVTDSISKEQFDYLTDKKIIKELLIKNEIISLTKEGEEVFSEKLKGKISYTSINKKDFPEKIFVGTNIKGENSIKIVKDIMSGYQSREYSKILESDRQDPLYKNSSSVSTYAGKPGEKSLETQSSKLNSIVESIKKTKGIVFIYSNNVKNNGVKLVSKILSSIGISNVALSKDVKRADRSRVLKTFNSEKNKNGSIIKVIIGSPVLSEGITLKNVRQVHILEPYWNMSKIDQVIGRVVRRGSHSDLPISERNVSIFLHTAIPDNKEDSIDIHKYLLSYYKDIPIKKTERLLKKIAIDCPLNARNVGKGGSRECDYDSCEYSCNYKWKAPVKFDKTTFYKTNKGSKSVNLEILKLFDDKFTLSFKNIQKNLPEINKEDIVRSLNDIIISKLHTPGDRRVTYKNGIYISTKKNINSDIIPEILFLELFGDDVIGNKNITEYNKRPLSIEKKSPEQKKVSPGKSKPKDFSGEVIYGTFVDKTGMPDKKFRIVLNDQNNDIKDKREIVKGKVCTSFSKPELASILKKYFNHEGENIRFISKEDLCKTVYSKLKDRKLME